MKRTLACLFHRPTFSDKRPSPPISRGPCSSHRPMNDEHPGPPLNHTTTGSLTGSLSLSAKKYEMCRVLSLPRRYPAYRADRKGSLHLSRAVVCAGQRHIKASPHIHTHTHTHYLLLHSHIIANTRLRRIYERSNTPTPGGGCGATGPVCRTFTL